LPDHIHLLRKGTIMTVNNTITKRFIAAAGIAATAVVAPALLLAGAATAHADDSCYGALAGSYYCSPASGGSAFGSVAPDPVYQPTTIGSTMWNSLPGCSGGVLAALDGEC
jgi:uncharacterized membrane protein